VNPSFDISRLHELETVTLCLAHSASASSVADTLASLGFVAEDAFCFAPRPDQPAPWQAINIAEATFYSADAPVDFDQHCDRIEFACCFSALPPTFTTEFIRLVAAAASLLGGSLRHRDQPTDAERLSVAFASYARDIFEELAEESGSEFLARTLYEFRATPGNV
jgi:hypothetical protein